MSEKAPKRFTDGAVSFEGGMDSGRVPNLIGDNQVAFAVNCTFRGGYASQRPGWEKQAFTDEDGSPLTGIWQCARDYIDDDGNVFLIALIAGRVYRWNPETDETDELTSECLYNPSNLLDGWMEQAENFLVIQDGQSGPLIFDGATLRRALPTEIKAGTVMRYVNGRIWYALPSGFEFRATDLVYSDGTRSSVLKEAENQFLVGGNFSVPSDGGPITALAVPGNLDTSLGQGPLLVFTPRYVFSVQAPLDRDAWASVNYPIVAVSLVSNGALGARSTITVNGDVFYRAVDGIRSFIIARRDFGTWGNTPISGEVDSVISTDNSELLRWGSAVVFDNRMLMTTQPQNACALNGITHKGLVVMDLELISNLREKLPPAWEGVWTGLNILQIVKTQSANNEQCFIFARNEDNDSIEIWEVTKDSKYDRPDSSTRVPVRWEVQTRAFDFESPFGQKRMDSGEVWVDQLMGTSYIDAKYRPDQYPGWIDWHGWSIAAITDACGNTGCLPLLLGSPQYRTKLRLPQPSDACDSILKTQYRKLYQVQIRFRMCGFFRLKGLRVHAYDEPEQVAGQCLPCETPAKLSACDLNPFTYSSSDDSNACDDDC